MKERVDLLKQNENHYTHRRQTKYGARDNDLITDLAKTTQHIGVTTRYHPFAFNCNYCTVFRVLIVLVMYILFHTVCSLVYPLFLFTVVGSAYIWNS